MSNNTKLGTGALQNNSGNHNTGLGTYSSYNTNSFNNTAIGSNSSFLNTTGSNNTSVGTGSMFNNTEGSLNTAVGSSALEGVGGQSVGNQNTAVGVQALYKNNGDQNTAIGAYAALGIAGGNYNTFLGVNSTFDDLSGNYNYSTAIGYNAIIDKSNQIMMGGDSAGSGIYPDVIIPGSVYLPNFTNTGDPDQIVPKSYVDTVAGGLQPTQTCVCATTSSIDLTSTTAPSSNDTDNFDLSTLSNGSYYVLLVNQNGPSQKLTSDIENGVYKVTISGGLFTWSRPLAPATMSIGSDAAGAFSFIRNGTIYGKTALVQYNDPAIVGTDALQYQTLYQFKFELGQGLNTTAIGGEVFLNVDSNLDFLNLVDASINSPTLNIGTQNATTINIGQTGITNTTIQKQLTVNGQLDVTGATTFSNNIVQTGNFNIAQATTTNTPNTLKATNVTSNWGETLANSTLQLTDSISTNSIRFFPNLPGNNYNSIVQSGDRTIVANTGSLVATVAGGSGINTGIRINATSTTIGYGSTTATPSSAVSCNATTVIVRPTLTFSDTKVQDSAFTGGTPGTYTNTNMTIDSNGKISAIANGTTVNITDVNTDAAFFPVFVSGSGQMALNIDSTTGPFNVNPSSGSFTLGNTMKIRGSASQVVAIGLDAGLTSQGNSAVALGPSAGKTTQGTGSVAVGLSAGLTSQGNNCVAIGNATATSSQGTSSVAIGVLSGGGNQGTSSVAIGNTAASSSQGANAVAIGTEAGKSSQTAGGIAIGQLSGKINQGSNSVAIGVQAGEGTTSGLGTNSIAIGTLAGGVSQVANSICLNASGVALNPAVAGLHINPVRNVTQTNVLGYNTTSKEITYYTPSAQTLEAQTLEAVLQCGNTAGSNIDMSGNSITKVSSITNTGNITIDPSNTLIVNGTLDVSGNTTLRRALDVSGNTTLGGTLGVTGTTSLTTLTTSGKATLNSASVQTTLDVSGNTTLGGTLKVTGATTLSNTLDVSGNGRFTGQHIDLSNNYGIIRVISLDGTNYIESGLTGGTQASSKPLVFSKYYSTGIPTLYLDVSNNRLAINKNNPTTTLDVNGNTTLGGTLDVTGATTLAGGLSGNSSTNVLEISSGYYLRIDSTSNLISKTFQQGTYIGWNTTSGTGTTDFICNRGGGTGGFNFYVQDASGSASSGPVVSINRTGGLSGNSSTNVLEIASGNYLRIDSTSNLISKTLTQGTYIGWNSKSGSGTTDFICNRGVATGGFNFYVQDASGSANIDNPIVSINGTGGITVNSLDVSGNTTLHGTLGVTGATSLSNTLGVGGNIDCSGNITAQYMFLSSYPPNINSSQNSVVPKGYVDSIASGIKPLPACVTVSFSPITLSGTAQTVSGVALSSYIGKYILVNGQNNSIPDVSNGVYIIGNGTWLRSTYLKPGGTYTEAQGTLTTILQGDYKNHRYICIAEPSLVGEDPLLWSEFDIPYGIGQGLESVSVNNQTILQVDPSLNFLTLVDASSSNPTLDIGTENALTIKMGKSNGSTTTNINGTLDVSGNTTLRGTLGVTGATSLTTLTTSGKATLQSASVQTTLDVSGNTTLGGTLKVTGPSANYSLDVSGNGRFTGQEIDLVNDYGIIRVTSQSTGNYIESGLTGGTQASSKPLIFSKYYSGIASLYLDVSNNRLAINKNNPTTTLDVNGNTTLGGTLTTSGKATLQSASVQTTLDVSGNVTINGRLNLSPTGITYSNGTIQNIAYTGAGSLAGSYTNTNMTIDSDGKITSLSNGSGGGPLGNTTINGTLDVSGNTTIGGSCSAQTFQSSSDYRLKTNIKLLNNNYTVDNLNPVEYDMSDRHDMGFLAHEVQELYPFLVNGEKDGKEMQSINYMGFIALLVKEIKDLKERVKILEEK